MTLKREVFLIFLSPLLLVVVGAGVLSVVREARWGVPPGRKDEALVREVLGMVRVNYVTKPDPLKLGYGAAKGVAASLDRYCEAYDGKAWRDRQREDRGRYNGIGVILGKIADRVVVLRVGPGGPASRAGVRAGDVIRAVDGRDVTAGTDLDRVQDMVQGPRETTVALELESQDGKRRRTVEVVRGTAATQTVFGELLGGGGMVGYVRVLSFRGNTLQHFNRELERLLSLEEARALILDLRANRGGDLEVAVGLVDRFLQGGRVVATVGRAMGRSYRASPQEDDVDLPLVVLVDRRSASAAEVVAGALQDHGRAVLVGERTYGKGVVQALIGFRTAPGGLKLTTAHYVTPAGRCIERSLALPGGMGRRGGLLPDIPIPLDDEERLWALRIAERRRYLPFVRRLLEEETPRPEGFRDRHLEAALDVLQGRTRDAVTEPH